MVRADLRSNTLLFVIIVVFISISVYHMDTFSYDDDEGMQLLKAQALVQGSRLYSDVWSDQPPLYTVLLAQVLRAFGDDIVAARTLSLTFGLIVMTAAWLIALRLGLRPAAGFLAALCVLVTPRFASLARSVMIDLPAIALSFVAVTAFLAYIQSRPKEGAEAWKHAYLAALLYGASLAIKPTMVQLGPIMFAFLLYSACADGRRKGTWGRLALWVAIAFLPAALCIALFGRPMIDQVVGTYLKSGGTGAGLAGLVANLSQMADFVADSRPSVWVLGAMGLVGLGATVRQRTRGGTFFAVLLLVNFAAVAVQTPFRARYMILIFLPLAILAAIGMQRAISWLCAHSGYIVRDLAYVTMVALILATHHAWQWLLPSSADVVAQEATWVVAEYTSSDDTIISDQGMITFRARRHGVPELAVISTRRIKSGGLTAEEAIDLTTAYAPKLVIFWENKLARLTDYAQWVDENYSVLWQDDDGHIIYIIADSGTS
jgi:4-amino-4-deoxy-L-arabinose transferase-like glycosyltransferase